MEPPLEEKMFYFQDVKDYLKDVLSIQNILGVLRHPKDVFKLSFLLHGIS